MVYLLRSLVFFISTCVVAALALPIKRTFASLSEDMASLAHAITTLDDLVKAFPSSGLLGAIEIEEAAATVITALDAAASDSASTGPLNDAQGAAIIGIVEGFEPAMLDAISRVVTDKAAFESALPGLDAVVLADLKEFFTAATSLATQLITNAPADLKPTATSLEGVIITALTSAVKAYET
uniref:Hydrophobic surface binding protein n=1 Tax=Mycena chlorophos TaxID=658473 RepID=A0ABQ0M607_MYCCL|nr:predicted protein [Mycena chlorophos]